MTHISTLDVINDMLASLGETPLNELIDDHPFVNAGLRMLKVANLREQTKSWWFNKERTTLVPQADTGFIMIPDDILRIDPTDNTLNYGQRGDRLYKLSEALDGNKYTFSGPVQLALVRLIDFEDLPATAAVYISCSAQKDFQKAYDADQLKYSQIKEEKREALITLTAEHIRNVGANLFRRESTARTLNTLQSGSRANRYNM